MDEIKKLENKDTSRVYNKIQEVVDKETGEVTTVITSFLQREKTKDDFIKLFVENIGFLGENLSNSALRVALIMIKNLNYQNVFKYDRDFVNYFVNKKILGKSSVYRAIKELEDKKVIFKVTQVQKEEFDILGSNSYIINPQIVGKGSFKDIKNLRQTIIRTFDFDKLELTQEVQVESIYEGIDEIKNNPNEYEIKNIDKQIQDKKITTDVLLGKKDDVIDVKEIENSKKDVGNENEHKIALEQELNKKRKLNIEMKKLELEERKIRMEEFKMGLKEEKKEKTLFDTVDEDF